MLPVSIYLTPDGLEMIEGPGVTISDLRNQYPGCGLIEVNRPDISHDSDLFTLVPGVLYQITLPITEGKLVRDPITTSISLTISVHFPMSIPLGAANSLESPEYSVVGGLKLYDDQPSGNKIKIKACTRRKVNTMKA